MARAGTGARTAKGLAGRLSQLAEGAELSEGRVRSEVVGRARSVVEKAERRLAVSGDWTVVALAGSTGSGKSSLFNALAGRELATPGVRRPTTSEAMALSWGDAPDDLLDFLQVRRRYTLAAEPSRQNLVLLDLPDHDSTEVAHRLEVDRLVQLVDLLVWVVDPQKYADAVLHEQYLQPMAEHSGVTVVVLNQIDRLPRAEADACVRDLERLLASEGLGDVPVLAVSAVTGLGLPHLQKLLAERVRDKTTAAQRLAVDVRAAAQALLAETGPGGSGVGPADRQRLVTALSAAAGVPEVASAVDRAWRQRGALATGWPVLSWLGRFRPDPLRRLHLDRSLAAGRGGTAEVEPARVGRTSLAPVAGAGRARVDGALRQVAEAASAGMPPGWSDRVRAASLERRADLPDHLDRAVSTTDLQMERRRRWWSVVRVLQWLLLAAALAGVLWLGLDLLLLYLQLPPLPDVRWWRLPAPTVLLGGGVLAGLLVAGASRVGVVLGAGRAAARARRALERAVEQVAQQDVLEPLGQELDRHAGARRALEQAAG
ncbi:ABC transporter [Auraticoccus sp. F435]|uniref:ABC transporter n=1 Tax=Auraticoccus cholistanensis TaxID=2656650 RepID=A0A6A9V244_9ACTN|nr:GTP-binding protein [Auraticoccus cholistanensis]MVA77690.1 ABC transporter [Auraticoccus cholistanensis]